MANPGERICPTCKNSVFPTSTNYCPICGNAMPAAAPPTVAAAVPVGSPQMLDYGPQTYEFSLGAALTVGWERFKSNAAVAIVGLLVWGIIHLIGSMIPIVSIIYQLFVMPAMIMGLMYFGLRLLRGQNPGVENVFHGFTRYWLSLGVYWILTLISICAMLPLGIALAVQEVVFHGEVNNTMIAIWIIVGSISLVLSLILYARYGLAFWFAADENCDGVMDAFSRSSRATEGVRLWIVLYCFVIVLVGELGLLACCIGLLVTGPIALVAQASLYEALKPRVPQKQGFPVMPA